MITYNLPLSKKCRKCGKHNKTNGVLCETCDIKAIRKFINKKVRIR